MRKFLARILSSAVRFINSLNPVVVNSFTELKNHLRELNHPLVEIAIEVEHRRGCDDGGISVYYDVVFRSLLPSGRTLVYCEERRKRISSLAKENLSIMRALRHTVLALKEIHGTTVDVCDIQGNHWKDADFKNCHAFT